MSTRSVIGMYTDGDKWRGKYVHSDGYPSGVGRWIYDEYNRHFKDNAKAMFDKLMAEPVGWSFLVGTDFTKDPGWTQSYRDGNGHEHFYDKIDWTVPNSYWKRGEFPDNPDGNFIVSDGQDDGMAEWAYIWRPNTVRLTIYKNTFASKNQWKFFASIDLDGGLPSILTED